MSHASLEKSAPVPPCLSARQGRAAADGWKQHNRLSLAGTSDTALQFFLNKQNYTKTLVFCLDNDIAGREAAAVMAKKYTAQGYIINPA
jgi:hypothetical protein